MKKERNLIIVGDSAFAEIAYEYFTHDSPYRVVAFSVEATYLQKETLFGLPVVAFETLESAFDPKQHDVFVAVVYTQLNRLRKRLCEAAKNKGYGLASYISSRAFVWQNAQLGEHCFIFENNVVQPFVKLGNNNILWSGNHIGHHSTIGDHCFIASHVVISGYVNVGQSCFLGVNATISNHVVIADDNWIGPGVTILKDTQPGQFFKPNRPEIAKSNSYQFWNIDPLE